MLRKILTKFLHYFLCFVFFAFAILTPTNSYAVYDGPRSTGFSGGSCDTGTLDFNPFMWNKDAEWVMSNPICIAFMAGVGAVKITASLYTKYQCVATNVVGNPKAAAELAADSDIDIPTLSPGDVKKQFWKSALCATRTAELAALTTAATAACVPPLTGTPPCVTAQGLVPNAATDVTRCCAANAGYAITILSAVAALAAIYAPAVLSYKYNRVCGHDWLVWDKVDESGVRDSVNGIWKRGRYSGSYQKCLEDLFIRDNNSCNLGSSVRNITNRYYREFIYGGKEYEDKSSGSCSNPKYDGTDAKKMEHLGYTSSHQRYYMTGPNAAPVFACHRFLSVASDLDSKAAYDCCVARSQNTICIENSILEQAVDKIVSGVGTATDAITDAAGDATSKIAGTFGGSFNSDRSDTNVREILNNDTFSSRNFNHTFCKMGTRCDVAGIIYETYASRHESNFICARTYSVCPYNHLLGGGTEIKEMETVDPTLVKNFCQFMNHCSKLPIAPYVNTSTFEGAYISSACKDMKGDSQNNYGYTAELVPVNTRGFSAPILQCFKETMENVFLFKAGFTECKDPDEIVRDDRCASGQYRFKKGEDLNKYDNTYTKSFFLKIQDNLQAAIKMALTFSIMAFGMLVLLGLSPITKKQLLGYIVKVALIMFFAVGDGWQYGFVKGVLGTSGLMADIMFKLDENKPENSLDGCQFPKYNYTNHNDYVNPSYPPGKEYLRPWDVLDCKIARALGFGPEVSVPNLAMMILAGLFGMGSLGLIFIVGTFLFAFFLIALTIRAIHIFLLSITAVIILLYLSPLTITLSLFTRTKSIFDAWWKQILGFSLQPMILFAYMAILITFFDKIAIGDITFSGDGHNAPKSMHCTGEAANTSLYCIFKIKNIQTNNALSVIGIGVPVLLDMNKDKIQTIIKSTLLLFIFMKFMDEISNFAKELVGGAALSSDSISAKKMATKAYSAMRSVQGRGSNALDKHGTALKDSIKENVKGLGAALGNKGKSVSPASDSQPPAMRDAVGKSDGGYADKVASSSKDGSADAVGGGGGGGKDGTSGNNPQPSAPPADDKAKSSAQSGGGDPSKGGSSGSGAGGY